MAAMIQAHAQHAVARVHQRQEYRCIGLTAGVRLHIGVVRTEQALHAVDCQLLGNVHVLAATVIALARIPFCILVGEHRSLRFQHARAGIVLRRDELDMLLLPHPLSGNGTRQFRIKSLDGHRLGIHGTFAFEKRGTNGTRNAAKSRESWKPRMRTLAQGISECHQAACKGSIQQRFDHGVPGCGDVGSVVAAATQRQYAPVPKPISQ